MLSNINLNNNSCPLNPDSLDQEVNVETGNVPAPIDNVTDKQTIPNELVYEIFSYLKPSTKIKTCSLVNKNWKGIADYQLKQEIYSKAFDKKKWMECFDADIFKGEDTSEDYTSLPENIVKSFYIRNQVLIWKPEFVYGKPLTLESLGELAKKHFPKTENGYGYVHPDFYSENKDVPGGKAGWLLMSDVVTESKGKKEEEQEKIVSNFTKITQLPFKKPTVLEASICNLTQFFISKTYLFSLSEETRTRCQEDRSSQFGDYNMNVGWHEKGLEIECILKGMTGFTMRNKGVALLQEYKIK